MEDIEDIEDVVKYKFFKSRNKIANTFFVAGFLILLLGFIAGIIVAINLTISDAISFWTLTLLTGVLFLGIGEIISLLQEIVDSKAISGNAAEKPAETVSAEKIEKPAGTFIRKAEEAAETISAEKTEEPEDVTFCENCNNQVFPDEKVCANCGTKKT